MKNTCYVLLVVITRTQCTYVQITSKEYNNTFPVALKYANEIKLRKRNKIIHKALQNKYC